MSTLCLPLLEPRPAGRREGPALHEASPRPVLGAGGHPQLQPPRVGAEGGPRAPSRPWLSSKQPWASSVLEARGPHLRPGRLWVHLCLRWQAVLPWVSWGRCPQPCRRHRGNPVSSEGNPPPRARPRVTDPASLLPTLPLCRPASPGPGQLLAKALRPAGPPVTPVSVQQVRPGPWRPISSDVGLLTPWPHGGCALCPPLPAALEPVTRLLTDAWPVAPAPAPSPKASETRAPAGGKKTIYQIELLNNC